MLISSAAKGPRILEALSCVVRINLIRHEVVNLGRKVRLVVPLDALRNSYHNQDTLQRKQGMEDGSLGDISLRRHSVLLFVLNPVNCEKQGSAHFPHCPIQNLTASDNDKIFSEACLLLLPSIRQALLGRRECVSLIKPGLPNQETLC